MPTFTQATPTDAQALLDFIRAFYAEEHLAFTPAIEPALHALLANPSLGLAFLISRNGSLAGYFLLTFSFSLERAGKIALLDELFIAPPHRRQGLATAALDHAAKIATAHDCRAMILEVDHANPTAHALYLVKNFTTAPRHLLTRPLP